MSTADTIRRHGSDAIASRGCAPSRRQSSDVPDESVAKLICCMLLEHACFHRSGTLRLRRTNKPYLELLHAAKDREEDETTPDTLCQNVSAKRASRATAHTGCLQRMCLCMLASSARLHANQ
mmetsp:Transcript_8591/g.16258  ORF Transcript_8591/g.16258 Transcript_8591/m.16258 type:complete len:122 (-) Transcript_8591:21-386(-)